MNEFEIINDALVDNFLNECVNFKHEEPPKNLFHYTSHEVAIKILEDRCLWMTYAFQMNDGHEFSHGMELFKEGLNILESAGVDKNWLDQVRVFFDQEKRNPRAAPFVFSTTQNGTHSRQWQDYGSAGSGVSIGIKTGVLTKLSKNVGGPVIVIYNETTQREIVQKVAKDFIDLGSKLIKKLDNPNYVREFTLAYFRVAYLQSMRFKKKNWQHEQEWRYFIIAKNNDPKVFRRTRNDSKIKYFCLDVPNLEELITEIIHGPNANDQNVEKLIAKREKLNLAFDIRKSAN